MINCNVWSTVPSIALQLITMLQMSAAAVSIAVSLLMLIGLSLFKVCTPHSDPLSHVPINIVFPCSTGVTLIITYQLMPY